MPRVKLSWRAGCSGIWLAMLSYGLDFHQSHPKQSIADYVHTSWTDREGAPQNVQALAQTVDGYLWLGTPTGLYRFDGARFTNIDSVGVQKLPATRVRNLLASRDGSLWVVFVSGVISHILDESIHSYSEKEGLPGVSALAESNAGKLVAATAEGLFCFQNGAWKELNSEWGYPNEPARQVFFDNGGTLWAIAGQRILYLRPGEKIFVDPGEPNLVSSARASTGR